MFALAIVLLLAAAAIVIWVIMGLNGNNTNDIHFTAPGIDTTIRPLTLFLLGALALLLIWAATRLFAAGTKRKYRQHKETKQLKRENEKLHAHEQVVREQEPTVVREREVRPGDTVDGETEVGRHHS